MVVGEEGVESFWLSQELGLRKTCRSALEPCSADCFTSCCDKKCKDSLSGKQNVQGKCVRVPRQAYTLCLCTSDC